MHPCLALSARCRLLEVSDRQQQARDAVTALCMGQHGGSVLLLVGHASGAIKLWELKTQLGGEARATPLALPLSTASPESARLMTAPSCHLHATKPFPSPVTAAALP